MGWCRSQRTSRGCWAQLRREDANRRFVRGNGRHAQTKRSYLEKQKCTAFDKRKTSNSKHKYTWWTRRYTLFTQSADVVFANYFSYAPDNSLSPSMGFWILVVENEPSCIFGFLIFTFLIIWLCLYRRYNICRGAEFWNFNLFLQYVSAAPWEQKYPHMFIDLS